MTAVTGTETGERVAILVVDDEEAVASVLARGLSYAGYSVDTARDGVDALEKMAARHYDVLLTDIHMPRLPGDEMQRLARERNPELAVLMITAADDIGGAVACLKDGVFDYLTKPFDLADVVVRVGKAVERQHLIRENNDYRRNLERRVIEQADRIRTMMQASLEALIHALEAKDPTTRDHSNRVSRLAALLATALRPNDEAFAAKIYVAALFHDIGKIGVPEAVLNKPGPLNEDEMEQVRRHPVIGETILSPLLDAETVAMVRGHHEQWNGSGYPDRRMGEDIPFGGRIIAVADAYDAMSSARPYRREILRPVVLDILRRGADNQWDGRVVAALLQLAEEGRLAKAEPVQDTVDRLLEAPPYVPIGGTPPVPPSGGGRKAA